MIFDHTNLAKLEWLPKLVVDELVQKLRVEISNIQEAAMLGNGTDPEKLTGYARGMYFSSRKIRLELEKLLEELNKKGQKSE